MINLILLAGDNYQPDTQAQFIRFLEQHGFNCIQVPLVEVNPAASNDDLRAENYCKHIDGFINPKQEYWIFGISKGAHWARVYASRRSNIKKLISCEETTLNPRLLVEYEKSRENYFITDYFRDATEHEEYDTSEKALDSVVSDNGSYFPKCPINLIWTTRNNEDEVYSPKVNMLKRRFEAYLRSHGCKVKSFTIDSEHNCTTHEKNFPLLLKYILS